LNDPINTEDSGSRSIYPPKPIVAEKNQNALRRSLISLFIYAVMFYFLFEQNITVIAAVLVVIIIHELGHFSFMKLFNYSNVRIFIVPLLGAFTSGKKPKVSQWQLCLIILAGPVPGIIIGSVLYWMNLTRHDPTLKMLADTFLFINLLNLLPFYPLDGGRLLETLFFKENHLIRLVFGIISILALVVLALFTGNPILLIIPALIGLEMFNENKHQKIRDYLKQERINYRTDYNNLPDKDYWLIRDCLILSFPKKYAMVPPAKYEYSPLEGIFIQHISAVLQADLKADLNVFKRVLMVIAYLFILTAPLALYAFVK
jgi:stage IV sporulation protein FB